VVDKLFKALETILDKTDAMSPFGGRRMPHSVGLGAILLILLFFGARLLLELPNLTTAVRVLIALAPVPVFIWCCGPSFGRCAGRTNSNGASNSRRSPSHFR
jgi:hypothetical protein